MAQRKERKQAECQGYFEWFLGKSGGGEIGLSREVCIGN